MSSHSPCKTATYRHHLMADGRSARGRAKAWTHSKVSISVTPMNILLAKASCMEKPRVKDVDKIYLPYSSETFIELQSSIAKSVHE